ncbi:DUF5060 domain-containing protein [Flammeovirgaceae bacterium SG7u.111]|nr:DUF5060 domain-containing protein [Flammeovirgaceae bacterium SG7u.132]WPO34273.1 DUF5060 domain-containing protein [Flammeovirgaceae bacterium SG7u.111]
MKLISLFILLTISQLTLGQGKVSGELKKWHKVTIDFEGPEVSEADDFNPFMNYRFNVEFNHAVSGKSYTVPGYFAADGNAGESSAEKGNVWRVHFAPDEVGEWTYAVDFRKGNWAAVSDKKKTGVSGEFMDGTKGSFSITETDKTGVDFRAKGRLSYVGGHYLQFEGTKEYFLKQGPDAPENMLSYADFDGMFHNDGHKDKMVKTWAAHLQDWKEGDPTWKEGKGKALIGGMNYLSSKGLNSVSFLTLNIVGDDQNVFPYIDYDTYDRFDVSKLDQWEIVFDHAQEKGLFLHFKLAEVENQGLLDNGGVGAQRKLYYRELIARFGHHLALNWNVCEESGDWVKNHKTPPQFTQQRLAMAQYFFDKDPYHHHVVIHNGNPFDDLLGSESKYTGPSVQTSKADFRQVHGAVIRWREKSAKAGKPWAVAVDEPGDAQHSLVPDSDDPEHNLARQNALWGAMMAGAWGLEWYFGYKHDHSDLTCEDWRSRDLFWDQCKVALDFFTQNKIPYWEMMPSDSLLSNKDDYCFAKADDTYIVFLKKGSECVVDLSSASGGFKIQWFNPRTGEFEKKAKRLEGGSKVIIKAPGKEEIDWVALIKK